MAKTPSPFIERGREMLLDFWSALDQPVSSDSVPSRINEAIDRLINSKTLSYRYALPTQLLAKVVDSSLNCPRYSGRRAASGSLRCTEPVPQRHCRF